MAKVPATYSLPPELKAWVEEMAGRDGLSASSWITMILAKLKREDKQ